jgi:hypothetical protein
MSVRWLGRTVFFISSNMRNAKVIAALLSAIKRTMGSPWVSGYLVNAKAEAASLMIAYDD